MGLPKFDRVHPIVDTEGVPGPPGPPGPPGGTSDLTTQLAWFIDPINGNDANDGKTLPTALKTLTRWFLVSCANGFYTFNTAGVVVTIATTAVGVPANLLSTDTPGGTIYVGRGTLKFVGVPLNVTPGGGGIGANVTVTAANPATNTPCSLVDTGIATFAAYVSAGFIPYRFRTTAGSHPGAEFWVMKATAANTARICAQMVPDPTLGPLGQSEVQIATGDAYVIEQLPAIPDFNIRFQIVPGTTLERVVFQDLSFSLVNSNLISFQNDDVGNGTQIGIYGCSFAEVNILGGDFLECRVSAFSLVNGRALVFAGLSSGDFSIAGLPSSVLLDFNFALQGGSLNVFSEMIIGRVQGFDNVATGQIIVWQNGSAIVEPLFAGTKLAWGAGGAALGFWRTQGNGKVLYDTNTTGMTGLSAGGAANACQIGVPSVAKAYAALPFVDANSFSGMFIL